MSRRTLATLLATAVTAVAGATAPPAAATPGFLTVTGTGAVAADFSITKAVTLDLSTVVMRGTGDVVGFTLWTSGSRRYVTQVVASRDIDGEYRRPATAAASVAGFGAARPTTMDPATTTTLKPGRYRIYLISDGEADIRIALKAPATDDITLRATLPVQRVYAARTATAEPSAGKAAARIPVTLRPQWWYTVFASFAAHDGTLPKDAQRLRLTACATPRGKSCGSAFGAVTMNGNSPLLGQMLASCGIDARALGVRRNRAVDARAEAVFTSDYDGTVLLTVVAHELY